MLNHIVLFRRLKDVAADTAAEAALVERMHALEGQIDAIRSWRVAANEVERAICWDYVLESGFDDLAGLNAYLFHPVHQALIADLKTRFEWAAVDYTVPFQA